MDSQYAAYLESGKWKHKRAQVINAHHGRCLACGTKSNIQVHHLTYERIFNEDLTDLMPLCELHHSQVESAIRSGALFRHGEVKTLHRLTLSVLGVHCDKSGKRSKNSKLQKSKGSLSFTQEKLISQPWFVEALGFGRPQFKKICRKKFSAMGLHLGKMMSNAFAIYDWKRHSIPEAWP